MLRILIRIQSALKFFFCFCTLKSSRQQCSHSVSLHSRILCQIFFETQNHPHNWLRQRIRKFISEKTGLSKNRSRSSSNSIDIFFILTPSFFIGINCSSVYKNRFWKWWFPWLKITFICVCFIEHCSLFGITDCSPLA